MSYCYQIFLRSLAVIFALSVLSVVPALAQVTTADVTGRVLDQLDAVVPNASVTARNTGTGQSRTTTTDEEGSYNITQLPPGTYEISVEASNFSKALLKDVQLNVGAKQTLNFNLNPGQITETVQVA